MKKDQSTLWDFWKSQVTPLKNKNNLPPPLPPLPTSSSLRRSRPLSEDIPQAEITMREKGSIPSRLQRCFRRPVFERKLDLHGETLGNAEKKVIKFLVESQRQGCQCVLIVTGKAREAFVQDKRTLRGSLPIWLDNLPQIVRSFSPSKQRDGGEGACYVFLKKSLRPFS